MKLLEVRLQLRYDSHMPGSIITRLEVNTDSPDMIMIDKMMLMDDFESTFVYMMEYLTRSVLQYIKEEQSKCGKAGIIRTR